MSGGLAGLLSVSLSGACLFGAAAGLARLLGGRISPNARRALWALVLLRLLCPWSLPGGVLDGAPPVLPVETAAQSAPAQPEAVAGELEQIKISIIPTSEKETYLTVWTGLTVLWAAGFAISLVRRGRAYAGLRRGLGQGEGPAGAEAQAVYARLTAKDGRPPRLRASPAAPCPMLVGVVRPTVYLPGGMDLTGEELEGTLAHELSHWRRKDLWLKWAAALAAAVHWFNPAVYLLIHRLDRDCELGCDLAVVRSWDTHRRARYGELLIRLAANQGQGKIPVTMLSQKQRLEERLRTMMEGKKYGKRAAALGIAACLALALTSTALGAYTGLEANRPAQESGGSEMETPTVLAWPVETGDTVELSRLFTRIIHPITGGSTQYPGIDIPQPSGTPVLAAADGAVLESGFDPGDGNYILLQHGSMTTKYTHLLARTVEAGETVAAGAEIGQVGKTGRATGDHLHFEVAVDGVLQDPLLILDSSVDAVWLGVSVSP